LKRNKASGDRELTILKGAVENTNEAFVTIDQNHQVLIFNRAAEDIFGYRREEVIGRDLSAILTPECSGDHRQAVARYLQTRNPRVIGHERELMGRRKNGENFPLSISFSVAQIADLLYFTGIIRDLTETKALQEQIKRSERLATMGQVVAEISHEIKNPLMMIGGFARQLSRSVKGEKEQTKLEIIAREVKRLETLIGELRELYHPKDMAVEVVDINALLKEVFSLMEDDCRNNRIELSLNQDAETPLVEGDRDKLKQVLLNLIKNGMEAVEREGNLIISSKVAGDQVEITIQDNGPGIPEAVKPKLFSPFFTTKKFGTGLGLSVSKKIIEGHRGGKFALASEEGKGTVARITMPARACNWEERSKP
jgi:PAS domain S-box-containing protein